MEKIRVKPRTKKAELRKTSSLDLSVSANNSNDHITCAGVPTPGVFGGAHSHAGPAAFNSSTTFASISP